MTKKQHIEHKIGNQRRKAKLLSLYYKVKPSERMWIPLGGVCQNGRHTFETGIQIYDQLPALAK